MPARRRLLFLLAVVLQILFLLGMVGFKQYTLTSGTPVLLKVVPVDPWDMFRGDYVRLRYEISQVQAPAAAAEDAFRHRQPVWVLLSPPPAGQKYWQAAGIYADRPEPGPGQVALRGQVQWYDPVQKRVEVQYGVEAFFVPERQGLRLEREPDRVEVEIAVDRAGRSGIRQVLWDGEPVEFE